MPKPALHRPARVDRLRLKQIRLVMAIGERASLKAAAEKIHVTQSTATKMIADLEQLLGAQLYERSPRGVHITAAGQEMLVFSRKVVVEYERLLAGLEAHANGTAGEVVIGSILGATPDIIADTVLEMKRREPMLTIRLIGETSDQVLELLESRVADIAVGRFNSPQQFDKFDFEPLGDEPLCFIARPDHPLANRIALSLTDLADAMWILQPWSTPNRQILETEFKRSEMRRPRDCIEASSILTIVQLLKRSDAVALMSEPSVRDHLAAGMLIRLAVDPHTRLPGFGLLKRKGEALEGYALLFATLIREMAGAKLAA